MEQKQNIRTFFSDPVFPKDFSKRDTFYYDETNNFRKLVLKKHGFNASILGKSFTLGGILLPNGQKPDPVSLKAALHFKEPPLELKFHNFLGKDKSFYGALNSPNIQNLLKWLNQEGLLLHFAYQSYLYWSIADIVDSLRDEKKPFDEVIFYNRQLKNGLFEAAMQNLDKFANFLYRYKYPNVDPKNAVHFLRGLLYYLNRVSINDEETLDLLKSLIKQTIKNPDLPLLQDNEDKVVVDSLWYLYASRITTFPNATHVFDHELKIEKELHDQFGDFEKDVAVSFKDSKEVFWIQISDVIVGLLSSFYSFCELSSNLVFITQSQKLKDKAKEAGRDLIKLIDRSVEYSKYTDQFIGPDNTLVRTIMFATILDS